MRIGHLQPSRPEWFDRSPVANPQVASFLIQSPVASAVLWTYTVPAGKKAWIASAFVSQSVSAAPTTASYGYTIVDVFTGGTSYPIVRVFLFSGVPGATEHAGVGAGWMVPAGVQIRGLWSNLSTGGTFELVASSMITEFDA